MALIGILTLAPAAAVWVLTSGPRSTTVERSTRVAQAAFEEETGIRVIRVALTGGGGLVDFRYQVIDPDKAEVVHLYPPNLVDEKTGDVIDALFMGHSHRGNPKAGYTYPLLFVNRAGLVQPGGAVAVVIGDWRLEHVPVM